MILTQVFASGYKIIVPLEIRGLILKNILIKPQIHNDFH